MKMAEAVLVVAACCFASGCGCGKEPEVKKAPEVKVPLSKSDELHQKAKVAEAASLVGYDGKDIHQKLDKLIDQQQEDAKRLEDLKDIR